MKSKMIIMAIFLISFGAANLSYAQKKEQKKALLGGWVVYEQQLGALDNSFFTLGGVSLGISFFGISVGLAVYGNYPYESNRSFIGNDLQFYYGGIQLGYKKTWGAVGTRAFLLLGGASTKVGGHYKAYFALAPSFHIDFHIFKSLVISAGVNYRYLSNESLYDLNYWKNSISGTLSIGWVH